MLCVLLLIIFTSLIFKMLRLFAGICGVNAKSYLYPLLNLIWDPPNLPQNYIVLLRILIHHANLTLYVCIFIHPHLYL